MTDLLGFSVTIFMPDEEPNGFRIVEMLNWTGQGIVFPRSRFERAKQEESLQQTGIYVLRGLDTADKPIVYVGEGENVANRLSAHYANKDFWTQAAAFVNKDMYLNKAHVQYLEARLWQIASDSPKCSLDNTNQPKRPNLSPPDRAFAEHFLRNLRVCMSAVGIHEFEELVSVPGHTKGSPSDDSGKGPVEFRIERLHTDATGYEGPDGGFVVFADSLARKVEAPGFAADTQGSSPRKRRELIEQGILVEDDAHSDSYRLTTDYSFNSVSQAASVLVAGSVNGRDYWKRGNQTLKEWQAQLVEDSDDHS